MVVTGEKRDPMKSGIKMEFWWDVRASSLPRLEAARRPTPFSTPVNAVHPCEKARRSRNVVSFASFLRAGWPGGVSQPKAHRT
jgi:hypothetical protein